MRKELLKSILSIPTRSRSEGAVIDFLIDYAAKAGIGCREDPLGNIYMTKGKPDAQGFYPMVCAHTDSVHELHTTKIVEENGLLRAMAYGRPSREHTEDMWFPHGCGGDDKAGVFICLELLERQSCLKAAFFVSEEIGCIGSRGSDPKFFENVGYCLEFDSPQGDIISFSTDGVQLFDEDGDFAKKVVPLMDEHRVTRWQNHPFTDVAHIKRRFDFSCINLPAGYYHMHSSREYVKLSDVENSIALGGKILDSLGQQKYVFSGTEGYYRPKRQVTGLILS